MKQIRRYKNTNFDSKTLAAALEAFEALGSEKLQYLSLSVTVPGTSWNFDTLEEFLAAADRGRAGLHVMPLGRPERMLRVAGDIPDTLVSVAAPTRREIESIISIFDGNAERCRTPVKKEKTVIFIGHGQDEQWRDLKDHLHEKHGYLVEAYEIGAREGHAIRDILEDMLHESSFALLLMTGEDETKDGGLRARQNVIHETGLFQGKLGFSRAIVLLEEGTEEFSNIHGIQQIRFSKGRIKETFGDVLAVLKREFG